MSIDTKEEVLHIPGRPSVPLERKDLWKFMEQSFASDSQCWTSAHHATPDQGAAIIEGSYQDYIVGGLHA